LPIEPHFGQLAPFGSARGLKLSDAGLLIGKSLKERQQVHADKNTDTTHESQ
jgi:hypothetical protein